MDQIPLNAEEDLAERRRKMVNDTLDALVKEAYDQAIARGDKIVNPSAWRDAVRQNLVAEARERGKGFLSGHYNRLIGGSRIQTATFCAFCERRLEVVWLEVGDKRFCDIDCAEGKSKRMSRSEWVAKVKKDGGYTSTSGEWVPAEQLSFLDAGTKKPPSPK